MALPYTHDEIMALGIPDPEYAKILAGTDSNFNQELSLEMVREEMNKAVEALRATSGANTVPEGIIEEDIIIDARDGYKLPVRIHRPTDCSGGPLVVLFHGGGFCLGDPSHEEGNARAFAQEFKAICVNVDYRLAPEHVFPAGANDCWDATKWAAANAAKIGADAAKGFVICGSSAGGNFADVVGHLARDEKLRPRVTGVLEINAALCAQNHIPEKYKDRALSHEQNKNAPMLNQHLIDLLWDAYKPEATSPLFSPLIHPDGHAGMPPVFMQICGMDPLRDAAIIYAGELAEAGVETKVKLYPGLPHGFFAALPDFKASVQFRQDTVEGFKWLLERR